MKQRTTGIVAERHKPPGVLHDVRRDTIGKSIVAHPPSGDGGYMRVRDVPEGLRPSATNPPEFFNSALNYSGIIQRNLGPL